MVYLIAVLIVGLLAVRETVSDGVCPPFGLCLTIDQSDCRRAQFVIGYDNQTQCRVCDANMCGNYNDVCPVLVDCPEDHIRAYCAAYKYTIGTDGITKCRGCPMDMCGEISFVCPSVDCSVDIPTGCAVQQFAIGSDNVTRCELCPKNGCLN